MVAIKIFLNCQNCLKKEGKKHQNYLTRRARNPQQDIKLSLKKYCKFCRQTQVHQEQILSRSRGGKN
ncbi:MAG: 50S ribosomal protein L33 [Candidatus Moeniiplasma glomeromycotorum]|nr:50S ribosomal protein L33 [Candidatus Moeniiplasma glomeromycotorum]MCE8162435.1 50S ribosomal protein L33 [Candidatus Moeniiplasma glomeromycotorum]MCE8163145.1 50S ribosomal protein L33 [Candidatus Moeniiplasma glomeromycotorum]MCE8166361.1 50S ribosomal protein L33 [Candidatus Moeniiplasma glomeromycotorum]MCE8166843.1 50S ribosomal protein L33 [Candidatus Moeniiplasma glomeromycotorum]